MKGPVHETLMALLQETQALLESPRPGTTDLKEYGHRRLNLFACLRSFDSLGRQKNDSADLKALLSAVLESDRRLISKLHDQMHRCRNELSDLAGEKQALKGYAWASRHRSAISRCRV